MEQTDRKKMRTQWRAHKLIWNVSGGRLGRKVGGLPVLELVTVGHTSGEERQILIWYFDDNGAPAIVGTNAGKDADPAWVKNLRANPHARARWTGTWHHVTAIELTGGDHDRVAAGRRRRGRLRRLCQGVDPPDTDHSARAALIPLTEPPGHELSPFHQLLAPYHDQFLT
jgi:deazaflavin-dependent oxidoreductase (nitroreductase family)